MQRADTVPAPSWVEIDLDALAGNISAILKRLPKGCRYCAVIKADAYGHGIDRVAPVLAEAGVDYAAVATNDEAFMLRDAGFTGQLMRVRGATLMEARAARPTQIEEVLTDPAFAAGIADTAEPPRVHLPLNSMGMGRDGLETESRTGRAELREILATDGLNIVGIMTHFPLHEPEDLTQSRERFLRDVEWVIAEGKLDRGDLLVHAASSLGLLAEAGIEFDMVRAGACLWGIVGPRSEFRNVMTVKSRVTSVNDLPAGASVGYDRTFRLTRDTRVANVSAGYANGIRRAMANRARVAVRGRLASVLGRISMNALTVDVSDIPDVETGDEVVLFGVQGEARVTRAMVEAASDTIMADLYCDWGRSNPRRYHPRTSAGKTRGPMTVVAGQETE
jgi:alanine racemase